MPDIHVHIHGADLSDSPQSSGTARKSRKKSAPKSSKPRVRSGWHKYMKNKKTQIKYKGGKNKGKLNLKAMGVKYRKKNR